MRKSSTPGATRTRRTAPVRSDSALMPSADARSRSMSTRTLGLSRIRSVLTSSSTWDCFSTSTKRGTHVSSSVISASINEYWNSLLLTRPPMRSDGWFCTKTLRPGMWVSCGRRLFEHLLRERPLGVRRERDDDASGVRAGTGSAGADEADQCRDVGVLRDRVHRLLLLLRHGAERNVRCRFGRCYQKPGIVVGDEAFRRHDIEPAGHDDADCEHEQHERAIRERPIERARIARADAQQQLARRFSGAARRTQQNFYRAPAST